MKKLIIFLCSGVLLICGVISSDTSNSAKEEDFTPTASIVSTSDSSSNNHETSEKSTKKTITPFCDGKNVTSNCVADDGVLYRTYLFRPAVAEKTEVIEHSAEPAQTHVISHEAVYSYETVNVGCVRANMGTYAGSCAKSQCVDGVYSGAIGRGSCSHHGGVARSDGPWYIYEERPVLVSNAWDEIVVDVPEKPAWTETVIISPAVEEYIEKVPVE